MSDLLAALKKANMLNCFKYKSFSFDEFQNMVESRWTLAPCLRMGVIYKSLCIRSHWSRWNLEVC